MKQLVIYGASYPDIVKLVNSINKRSGTWKIIGFLDDTKKGSVDSFMNFPILGGAEEIQQFRERNAYFINNVFGTTRDRQLVAEKLAKYQVDYVNLISPTVDTDFTKIGQDCVINDGVTLGANTIIGNHVGIRSNSSVNHDSVIENYVFIGPGVTVCGHVTIREGAYVGAGSVIKQGLVIDRWSTVGMGAVVNKNVKEADIVSGNPARSIKNLIPSKKIGIECFFY